MKIYYFLFFTILFNLTTLNAQGIAGCTDPQSMNYNPNATVNDSSCAYPSTTVSPEGSVQLDETIEETSGLILWNGLIFTHNDDTDINLYGLDPVTGEITATYPVAGTVNHDWEDIDQDDNYIYIADTGNNANGNRTDLNIIRVDKAGLQNNISQPEFINFTYEDQTNITPSGPNNTDFDCEAIIVGVNNIYLFTKQWVSKQTNVYALPKTPGVYVAQLIGTFDVEGLITGATWLENDHLIALSGYTTTLQTFVYLFYDYPNTDFFAGNHRKFNLSLPFHQIEGITTNNGLDFYLSNEHFQQGQAVNVLQQLHYIDLSLYLENYLAIMNDIFARAGIKLYPNPAADRLYINGPESLTGHNFYITDVNGRLIISGQLESSENEIDIATLHAGIYTVTISGYEGATYKLAKK